jgi:hypothetical protein
MGCASSRNLDLLNNSNTELVGNPPSVEMVVREHVVRAVNSWKESKDKLKEGWNFYLFQALNLGPPLNRLEAIFIAENLRHELPLEAASGKYAHFTTTLALFGQKKIDVG